MCLWHVCVSVCICVCGCILSVYMCTRTCVCVHLSEYVHVCAFGVSLCVTSSCRQWLVDGVKVLSVEDLCSYSYKVRCESTHLTSFSVIVDIVEVNSLMCVVGSGHCLLCCNRRRRSSSGVWLAMWVQECSQDVPSSHSPSTPSPSLPLSCTYN